MKEAKINIKLILLLLFGVIFTISADTLLISPLIPLISKKFNISISQGGLLITAYAVFYAIFALGFGPLSDRVGRGKMLKIGMFFFAFFTIMCGFAWNYWSMFLFRALSGVTAAAAAPQVWASLGDLVPFEKRGRAMGVLSAGISFSQIIGVPLAALIAGFAGWNASFFSLGGLSLIIFLGLFVVFPAIKTEDLVGQRTVKGVFASLGAVLKNKMALAGVLVTFFVMFGSFGTYSFLGSWLSEMFKMEITKIGYIVMGFGLASLVGNIIGGVTADALGKGRVVVMSIALVALACLALPFTGFNFILAVICILVWAMSAGATTASLNSILSELVPHLRGTIMSINNSVAYLGTTIGVLINAIVLKSKGFNGIGIVSGCAVLVAVIIVASLARHVKLADAQA